MPPTVPASPAKPPTAARAATASPGAAKAAAALQTGFGCPSPESAAALQAAKQTTPANATAELGVVQNKLQKMTSVEGLVDDLATVSDNQFSGVYSTLVAGMVRVLELDGVANAKDVAKTMALGDVKTMIQRAKEAEKEHAKPFDPKTHLVANGSLLAAFVHLELRAKVALEMVGASKSNMSDDELWQSERDISERLGDMVQFSVLTRETPVTSGWAQKRLKEAVADLFAKAGATVGTIGVPAEVQKWFVNHLISVELRPTHAREVGTVWASFGPNTTGTMLALKFD